MRVVWLEWPLCEGGALGFGVPMSSGRTSSGSNCCCFSRCGGSAVVVRQVSWHQFRWIRGFVEELFEAFNDGVT